MADSCKIIKITGPPGCGKTTKILALIQDALQRYFPTQIGAVSFTNAAVETVKDRITAAGVDRSTVKNVRTMHSHCFKLLGLNSKNIAEYKTSEFNNEHPTFAVKSTTTDDGSIKQYKKETIGTYLYNQMNLMRNHGIPRESWPPDVAAFARAWFNWMQEKDYWDFTRMLEETIVRKLVPKAIEVLFVDESQDLTPLQMRVIQTWTPQIAVTYFAGDSDQCIFRFSGAVPEAFINLEYGDLLHLQKSYRVPPAIHAYAQRISAQIGNREHTEYDPDQRRGPGQLLSANEPNLELPGSHMIICRCNYQVTNWINWLLQRKVLWHNPYRIEDLSWNPQHTKSWQAVLAYQKFMDMQYLSLPEFHTMIGSTIAKGNIKRGYKKYALNYKNEAERVGMFDSEVVGLTDKFMDPDVPVTDKFKISGRSESVLLHMLARQKSLADQPCVIVGTIHSVKGGEADNVWIDTGIPGLIWNEMRKNERTRFDEARVAYVAATRARNRLGILNARNRNPIYPKI